MSQGVLSQLDRFARIAKNAQEINACLVGIESDLLRSNAVHFRPTSDGVTMVSLMPNSPQTGKGGYSAKQLAMILDSEFSKYCTEPQRPTPEKELQSFIIRNAYANGKQMELLKPQDGSIQDLRFVTDELTILDEKGRKHGCDILAVRIEKGEAIPILVELKSERKLTELLGQLNDYSALMQHYLSEMELLFNVILNGQFHLAGQSEKWIVWPAVNSWEEKTQDPREEELKARGVRVVQYYQVADIYKFNIGSPIS